MVDAPGGLGSGTWRHPESVSEPGCSSVPGTLCEVVGPALAVDAGDRVC